MHMKKDNGFLPFMGIKRDFFSIDPHQLPKRTQICLEISDDFRTSKIPGLV